MVLQDNMEPRSETGNLHLFMYYKLYIYLRVIITLCALQNE